MKTNLEQNLFVYAEKKSEKCVRERAGVHVCVRVLISVKVHSEKQEGAGNIAEC